MHGVLYPYFGVVYLPFFKGAIFSCTGTKGYILGGGVFCRLGVEPIRMVQLGAPPKPSAARCPNCPRTCPLATLHRRTPTRKHRNNANLIHTTWGTGMAPGSPHEASVTRNIVTAYDFAVNALHWDPKNIILFGRSIGTGPAVKLSAELDCGGLILVSPYTSVKDMVRTHAGIVTSWLTAELTNVFPSENAIQNVNCPTLIVHGATDRVIPSGACVRAFESQNRSPIQGFMSKQESHNPESRQSPIVEKNPGNIKILISPVRVLMFSRLDNLRTYNRFHLQPNHPSISSSAATPL